MAGLYDKLQIAVKYKMAPDDVTAMIDESVIIDTDNSIHKSSLMMADIELIKNFSININEVKEASRVIYWKTDDGICGLAWLNENVYSFSGKVLTP